MSASISVVTVTLNADQHLPALLASLRNQTLRDFEFIVIDGQSTDNTWRLIESAGDIVTTAICETDHGLYDALNKAIRLVKTDYYVVVGADDKLNPDAIANFRAATKDGTADVVVADVQAGGVIRKGFKKHNAWLGHAAMVTSHSVGMLFRTCLHDRFGMYSLRYSVMADGLFIKKVCTAESVHVVAANFLSGQFGIAGQSNRNIVQVLCETWQVQLDSGENPLLQYLLFQLRLLRYLPRILSR